MAVTMRLKRLGRRNRPYYRVIVADSRSPRDGRFIDSLGQYDPLQKPSAVALDEERVMKWLNEGVRMSDTVRTILKREGVLKRWKESMAGGIKEKARTGKTAEPVAGKAQKVAAKKPKKRAKKEPEAE
jgi:small subunit ribosomal protein S16